MKQAFRTEEVKQFEINIAQSEENSFIKHDYVTVVYDRFCLILAPMWIVFNSMERILKNEGVSSFFSFQFGLCGLQFNAKNSVWSRLKRKNKIICLMRKNNDAARSVYLARVARAFVKFFVVLQKKKKKNSSNNNMKKK